MNVEATDGTLLISRGMLTGGSAFTLDCAKSLHKPVIHIDLSVVDPTQAEVAIKKWLSENEIRVLNVAGPRVSEDPLIYELAKEVIKAVLSGK
jgi:hypothetical protein